MSAVQHHESTTGGTPAHAIATDAPIIVSAILADEIDSPRRGIKIRNWLKTGTGLFSSAITILAATLTVIFLLLPSLRPNPPAAEFGATLSDPKIETDVALSDYYARLRTEPPASLSGEDLLRRGVVVSFTVVIEGFQNKECRLRWSMFDAGTSKRLSEEWLVAQPGWPAEKFIPVGMRDQANGEIFVPQPPGDGSYFVRLELSDPSGTPIATLDSPTFAVASTQSVSAPATMPAPGAP